MKITKRETLIQNIAYMALMAAINVIFVLLTTLVPVLMFLIIFVLPLTSTMVTLLCKKKYFPIYAIATIALCMIVTIRKIDDTIFYVIPSIITGFVFGIMMEKGIPSPWIILTNTIIQLGLSFASVPLIQLMLGRNIINDFATVFKVNDFAYLDTLAVCFIFLISLIQMIFSYMVTKEEMQKLGFIFKTFTGKHFSFYLGLATSLTVTLICSFFYSPIAYLFTLISLYFIGVIIVPLLLEKKKWIYFSLGALLIICFFLVGGLYTYIKVPNGLLLINTFFIGVGIIGLINNYLLIRTRKDRI